MKNVLQVIAVLFMCAFVQSCRNDSDTYAPYDVDAQRFIDSSGITDYTQKIAINSFVYELKNSSLWAKFVAIYPMVGGTAGTTKWNLKDPRNSDAAYRLTFNGTPVFAGTGVLFPTISDYADTHLADSAIGGCTNAAISYYSRTQNTTSGYDMGCSDGTQPYNELSIYFDGVVSASADNTEWFGVHQYVVSINTTGLFMLSSSATNITRYRNGVVVISKAMAPVNKYTNLTFLLGKSRVTVHPGQKECALATIGNGLTDAQALTFYTIVQNFETTLGR